MRLLATLRDRLRPLPRPPAGFVVVSTRRDGLCMRLNTLLDVMVLARAQDAGFAFLWSERPEHARDSQTTSDIRAVFDARFLRHRIKGPVHPDAPVLSAALTDPAALPALHARARATGQLILPEPRYLAGFYPVLGPFPADAYTRAFADIGFIPPVRAAIDAARALPVAPDAAVIHLRGGDVLHGSHAYNHTFLDKVPTLSQIDAAIRFHRDQGREVWLIGQEPDIQSAMVARHPGTRAPGITDPLPPGLTPVGAVLFDVVLISRMAHAMGGFSAVSMLARRLARLTWTDISKPDAPPVPDIPDDAFPGVSVDIRAHARIKPVCLTDPAAWTDTHLDLIRQARALRPANAFYMLVEACMIARLHGPAAGEQAARAFLSTAPLEPGIPPDMGYSFLTRRRYHFPHKMAAIFTPAAGPASALLAAIVAALHDPAARPAAHAALATMDAELAPTGLRPEFRGLIAFCIDGRDIRP